MRRKKKPEPKEEVPSFFIPGRFLVSRNFLLKLLFFFRDAYSRIRFGKTYVLDTNMIVSSGTEDGRWKKFGQKTGRFAVSEQVQGEVEALLAKGGYKKIFRKSLGVVRFGDLRNKRPDTCPLYYNFISAMHNPALVWGENFSAEFLARKLFKNGSLTEEEHKTNVETLGKMANRSPRDEAGEDVVAADTLRRANISLLNKKRKAIKGVSGNYFNDLKTLSLSFLLCLQERKNVTLVTADADFLQLITDLFSTLTQQISLSACVLSRLDEDGKRKLVDGHRLTFFLETIYFVCTRRNLQRALFDDYQKRSYVCFRIRYWDVSRQEYLLFTFRIDERIREAFLNCHGQLFCPGVRNIDFGRWISYRYWWPPSSKHDFFTLKVVASAKKGLIKRDALVDDDFHKNNCKYAIQDGQGDLMHFSNFV